ncbi:MAG: DUF2284 domain-containing protein [Lachnospiraceae bacterium]|nr:DUF2284 domain-containing protein [Lachnospiraceae bacterium]
MKINGMNFEEKDIREFRTERYEADVPVSEYLETCVDVPTFAECCRACPNYNQTWSCPEFDFDPVNYWKTYDTLHLIGEKIYLPESLTAGSFSSQESSRLTARIMGTYKNALAEELLQMEKEKPGSISLSGGYCTQCAQEQTGTQADEQMIDSSFCTRGKGLPCRHPERMRYSIEALGGNVGLTVTKYLHQKLLWMEDGKLPEYYMLVLGLLY